MATRFTFGRRALGAALLFVVCLVAASCSVANDSTTGSPTANKAGAGSPSASTPANGNTEGGSFKTDALNQSDATTPLDPSDPNAGRAVISTATMTVAVDDVGGAKDKAAAAVAAHGGFVFGEQTTFGEKSKSVLTLKVPPENFRKLLDEIGRLGNLSAEEVKTDDVTQQVVDLDARIAANGDSLDRTRNLLTDAKSLTEIQQLENEVVRRQSDLESLRGQQKALLAKVSLSTIVATLTGDKDATPAVERQREEDERKRNEAQPLPGFGDGLSGGLRVAATIGTVTLAVFGALLPFLPLIVLAVVGYKLLRRRDQLAAAVTSDEPSPSSGGTPAP